MPSKSAKQHRFMEAIAHSPEFAKKAGVPQSVGKDFAAADKGKKFVRGGSSLAKINKQNTRHGKMDMPFSQLNRFAGMKAGGLIDKGVEKQLPTSKQMGALGMKSGGMKESKAMVGKEVNFMKKMGAPKSMVKHEAAEMGAMKKGGMMKYAEGGKMPMKDGKPAFIGDGKGEMKMGGMAKAKKMMGGGMSGYAKGGGIESRGKTKGMMVKMATGGVVKFAKGGGIESKGKTKGTMIKMQGC